MPAGASFPSVPSRYDFLIGISIPLHFLRESIILNTQVSKFYDLFAQIEDKTLS